ncbi:hypothetical protein EV178_000146 [Coemansia sp. RSA 1646]|nr:hypothetical protein EV178_000146 [Coemansia sp. RSA 1646]KAJ2093158.1 hypothetical protein IW138_000450 [Coemansia sp. RSA 986]
MPRYYPYDRVPANKKAVARHRRESGGEPLAIISTCGPSVLSAALVPSGSHLQKMSLLADNPFVRLSDAKPMETHQSSSSSSKMRGKMRRQRSNRRTSAAKSTDLLVSSIDSRRDAADVRSALVNSPEARCLVEYHNGMGTCITTLRDDGFVWNLSALLDPRSAQFTAVARHSPFMCRFSRPGAVQTNSSIGDSDGSIADDDGDLLQVDCVTVHEIHHEDCPSLL